MQEAKKIYAVISYPFLPATTGGEISTMQILNYLGKVNSVEVFTVEPYQAVNPADFDFKIDFALRFTPSRYLNPFLVFKVISNIRRFKADFVFFDQPWMGWMIPFIRLFTGRKVFLRSNNLEYLRFKSMNKSWWGLLYMYEKFVYRSANMVVFVSDVDQANAIYEFDLKSDKTMLTPYGIPHKILPEPTKNARQVLEHRHSIPSHNKILLFFATLSYQPNFEAVAYIADEIYPRLCKKYEESFTILICGKNLPPEINKKLEGKNEIMYLGFVEDIETYIDGSDIMINPILSGGGVKTKAIDTLGRGQVVLSTTTGAEGIDPKVCGSNLIIAPDHNWDEFIEEFDRFIKNPSRNLPDLFFETYSWPGIISKLMKKLSEIR